MVCDLTTTSSGPAYASLTCGWNTTRFGLRGSGPAENQRYMLNNLFSKIFLCCALSSCIHMPSYYENLEEVFYTTGNAKFSDENLNREAKYGSLYLREDGACSITEIRAGGTYRGSGAWNETDHENIISIGLSSNSAMTIYYFYVRLSKDSNTYTVSDKLERLIGM